MDTRLRDGVRRLQVPRRIDRLEQTAFSREPFEQPGVAQAGIGDECAAGPDVLEARCDRGGSGRIRQGRSSGEQLELVDDPRPDRVRHHEYVRHAGTRGRVARSAMIAATASSTPASA